MFHFRVTGQLVRSSEEHGMSVATEFPPAVFIPLRARHISSAAAAPAAPAAVPAQPARRPRLRLVPPVGGCRPDPTGFVSPGRRGIVRVGARAAVTGNVAAFPLRPAVAASPTPGTRALRLTRRGVIALAVGVVAAGALLLIIAHASLGSAPARPAVAPAGIVTVQPGDTLWSIAGQVDPGRDPRRVIERIRRVNHLDSVSLTPGQTLKVG
jgi:LysM domain